MHSPHFESLTSVAARLKRREITSTALTRALLDRIESVNPRLNAYLTVTADEALAAAREADAQCDAGNWRGMLHGIPVAVKDNIAVAGVRMTAGSALWPDETPARDADVVARLRAAGAVLLGKTAMHELAYGTTGLNAFFGDTVNPWGPRLDPGGSSSGSAVAVAAGLAFAALGTDTACSIRYPAHCCGVTGFKPTQHVVSATGVVPLVPTLDHVGWFTRGIDDSKALWNALGAQGSNAAADLPLECAPRMGVLASGFANAEPDIARAVEDALVKLERAGATLVECADPQWDEADELTRLLFREAWQSFAAPFNTQPERFSAELHAKLARKATIAEGEWREALQRRTRFIEHMERIAGNVDVMVTASAQTLPASLDAIPPDYDQLASRNAALFNLSGQPSLSMRCGFARGRWPVGLLVSARRGHDARLFAVARWIEAQIAPRGAMSTYAPE
ncbi:amidase [Paraburkholderia unamae]|uniref:Aspartyl-tRNA(Asn)/glutamyl-tRNA(Gln) amidotransferase subunit A n=1 Tax=Paraburkholderia unamae TaxID=219649 RepID=A0ABX5KLI8_9BURK|nr:amidase [Paraburkholderia unamae]PVX81351.1 aspartyl-tRNA(Asn)/glutamyl-tRNA(Gln) amidotransferase subunit A [Paraburkholderia unamae]